MLDVQVKLVQIYYAQAASHYALKLFKNFYIFFWNKFYSLSKSEIISMLDFKFSCVFHLPISSPLLTVYDLISILYCSPKLPLASCRCSHGYKPLPPPQGVHLFYSALLFVLRRFHFYYSSGRGTTPLSQTMQYMWTICMRLYWIS